jgi:hypothetical protein
MSIYNFCFEEVEDSVTKDEFAWIFRFTRGEGTPDGPTCKIPYEDQKNLSQVAVRLSLWLEHLELLHRKDQNLSEEPFQEFLNLFIDEPVREEIKTGENNFLTTPEETIIPERLQAGTAVLYIAVCQYLRIGERYIQWNARIIYLFSAWQAYSLLKSLCRREEERGRYLSTMAECYNRLIQVLEDRNFRDAVRWLIKWHGEGKPDDPLIRQHLRRSLVLSFSQDSDKDIRKTGGEEINPRQPIWAPGAFKEISWKDVNLHPVYTKEPGIRAVRQLITEWLLPYYDFDSAFKLAYLSRNPHPSQNFLPWINRLPWLGIFFILVVILSGNIAIRKIPSVGNGLPSLIIACLETIALGSIFWVALRRLFDPLVLPHLAMPRMLGGIVVGYTVFVTQGDAVNIVDGFTLSSSKLLNSCLGNTINLWSSVQGWKCLFWGGLPLVVLLWIGILIVGYLYLYYDARPWAGEKKESRKRAWYALSIALLSSAFIGLAAVAMIYAAFGGSDPSWGSFLGPFGWVDIKQWLVFTPLALITGLVSQFLLEDRTLATSVWAPEQF